LAASRNGARAFTVVEAVIALSILALFGLGTTVTLNLFDNWAAHNRNTEAARAIVDDYVNYLLNDNTTAPAATGAGTDIDGDGIPDGVVCTAIATRQIPNSTTPNGVVPLIVTRTSSPSSVVYGTLYWRVQAVGTAFGMNANTDLVQVNFLLAYTYRGRSYYYKAMTFKANT
jgi:type II secretory pathway pseudopilin PulG